MVDSDCVNEAQKLLQKAFTEKNIEEDTILDNELGFKLRKVDEV